MRFRVEANRSRVAVAALVLAVCCAGSLAAGSKAERSPAFTREGELVRPADYREWVYVTSGLGMTYGSGQAPSTRPPLFDNVFVTREAYREFMRSGTWPEKTMLILELRRGEENVSINKGGRTQGAVTGLEAAVKDRKRFPEGGWGYFSFDRKEGLADRAAVLPRTASCYGCHQTHGAVDNTFVQFYPTLHEVAKRFGTVKPAPEPGPPPAHE